MIAEKLQNWVIWDLGVYQWGKKDDEAANEICVTNGKWKDLRTPHKMWDVL